MATILQAFRLLVDGGLSDRHVRHLVTVAILIDENERLQIDQHVAEIAPSFLFLGLCC